MRTCSHAGPYVLCCTGIINYLLPVVVESIPAEEHSECKFPAAFAIANILEDDHVS
jgi:hypothetical protein